MIKLVIFDVDGVIVDSESRYIDIAGEISRKRNYNIPREALLATLGTKIFDSKHILLSYMDETFNHQEYYRELKEEYYKDRIENLPDIKKGFFELVDYIKHNDLKMAFATSTFESFQEPTLSGLDILKYFDYYVYGDQITESKPSPQIYLNVINHFDFDKDEIIIIEDSSNGIKSGLNAGVKVVFVPDLSIVPQDVQDKVYAKVDDLSKVIDIIEKNK